MKLTSALSISLLSILLFVSCNNNKWEVDVESITTELVFSRFELDLLAASTEGISAKELAQLHQKYPQFLPLYVEGIMGFGRIDDPNLLPMMNQFVSNKDINELLQKVKQDFPENDLKSEFEEIENSFKRFHYYFPERIVPKVVTMTAAFNYATAADDSVLAIGLDTYLGGDYEVYPQIGIPKYKFQNFDRKYLTTDAMKAWLLTEFETAGGQNLLEQMVFHGKAAYLLSAFMPEAEEHLFFNYSKVDFDWCKENEGPIWFHFIDMELLFASENHQIRKYMGDAPFVAGFPEGSPGRVGQWVGFQLVKSYMENNTDVTLSQLMETQDANKILRKSNYKPRR